VIRVIFLSAYYYQIELGNQRSIRFSGRWTQAWWR